MTCSGSFQRLVFVVYECVRALVLVQCGSLLLILKSGETYLKLFELSWKLRGLLSEREKMCREGVGILWSRIGRRRNGQLHAGAVKLALATCGAF